MKLAFFTVVVSLLLAACNLPPRLLGERTLREDAIRRVLVCDTTIEAASRVVSLAER